MNQKCANSRKVESEIKNTPGTICTSQNEETPRGYLFASIGPPRGLSE